MAHRFFDVMHPYVRLAFKVRHGSRYPQHRVEGPGGNGLRLSRLHEQRRAFPG